MANYFSENLGINSIPNFIRAGSSQGLRRLMLRVSRNMKGYVNFNHIQWNETEKLWYAWYVVNIDKELEQLLTETGKEEPNGDE